MPDHKWCHDVMRHEMCERLSCEICKAHLPRPCSSSVPPPAPPASPSAAQWGLMMHGLRHANSMTCDCLARFARFTRRASSSPALLALLPLREQVLRERPVRCSPPSSCDKDWGEKHKHTRSDNVVVAVAETRQHAVAGRHRSSQSLKEHPMTSHPRRAKWSGCVL